MKPEHANISPSEHVLGHRKSSLGSCRTELGILRFIFVKAVISASIVLKYYGVTLKFEEIKIPCFYTFY